MKKIRKILALALALLIIQGAVIFVSADETDVSRDILNGLSTEEKITQMLMPTFRYATVDGKLVGVEEISDRIAGTLSRYYFSGVILFAQNAANNEKTVRLLDAMQKANLAGGEGRAQLFTAVDQEGGIVTRLGQGTSMGGNMALGAVGDLQETERTGRLMGEELAALGFNMDFAPVVDVNSNPYNPVIGVRSFSDDPAYVAEQSVSLMRGLDSTGVIATLKHFPGHGDTATDSHTGMVVINKTYEELKNSDLVPFKACVDAGTEMIMTAHIQYPRIETKQYTSITTGEQIFLPATLSKTIITDILRGDMGFEGVVVTDAMNMDAIAKHFRPLDSFALAVEAGVDIVLMPVDLSSEEGYAQFDRYIADLVAMAENGTLPMDKIDAAVYRILKLKERKGLLNKYEGGNVEAMVERAVSTVGSREHHEIEWEITKKAITLVKNDNDTLPVPRGVKAVTVLTATDGAVLSMQYAYERLREEGYVSPECDFRIVSYANKTFEDLIPSISGSEYVIASTFTSSISGLYDSDSVLVDRIMEYVHSNGGRFVAMSIRLPYDAARYTGADAMVLAYSSQAMSEDPRVRETGIPKYGPNMPAALYLMFKDDESPVGKLPLNIPALDQEYRFTDTVLYRRGFGLRYKGFENTPSDWAVEEVEAAVSEGLVPAELQKEYRRPVTRGQVTRLFINLIEKILGKTVDDIIDEKGLSVDTEKFTDTSDRDVFSANALGVINGTSENKFTPEGTLKRAHIAAIINRIAHLCGIDTEGYKTDLGFTDITGNYEWVGPELGWPVHAGIIKGVGNARFSPGGDLTTEQAILIVYRTYTYLSGK